MGIDVEAYYLNPKVSEEIIDYSRGRWIALECESKGDKRIFVRYWSKGGQPLRVGSKEDLEKILGRFKALKPRAIYATIHIYKSLENVEEPSLILNTTPIWDIDVKPEDWPYALQALSLIHI